MMLSETINIFWLYYLIASAIENNGVISIVKAEEMIREDFDEEEIKSSESTLQALASQIKQIRIIEADTMNVHVYFVDDSVAAYYSEWGGGGEQFCEICSAFSEAEFEKLLKENE